MKTKHPSLLLLALILPVLLFFMLLQTNRAQATTDTPPVIDIWYGLNQNFGQPGMPQEWIDILGTVSDTDATIARLFYSLNGGITKTLTIGPDDYRLAQPGDFNAEIAFSALQPGANNVTITAFDSLGNQSAVTVVVNYVTGSSWPMPFSIDWSIVTNIRDVAQVVDGKWTIGPDGLRPTQLDYDRAVAIGDQTSWTNYEVMVPVKVHGIDPNAPFGPPSGNPGVGFLVRWQGHNPNNSIQQPNRGWERHGALGWYRFFKREDNTFGGRLTMVRNVTDTINAGLDKKLNFETLYNFKLRSATAANAQSYYHMKVWEASQPEPFAWDLISRGTVTSTNNGSLLLLAHHVDASFGNIQVTPVTDLQPDLAFNQTGNGSVAINPNPSQFPSGIPYGTIITVTATAATGSYFSDWTGDLAGQPGVISFPLVKDMNFTANFKQDLSGLESDDFNACSLNANKWSFNDPLGDGVLTFNGKQAMIGVPAGIDHNVWRDGNNAPRLMQPANNTDLDLEVKFDSPLTQEFQVHGLVVEQDADNFVRFDFNSDGTATRILAIAFQNGNPVNTLNFSTDVLGNGAAPTYMRVARVGNQWSQSYSADGTNWRNSFSFEYPLTVSSVGGFFAGNIGTQSTPAPAYTGFMDYFFNRAAPITPEDGVTHNVVATTAGTGSGSVGISQPSDPTFGGYKCGEVVTLTAVPATGSTFGGWGGDATGTGLTTTVTINGGIKNVVATFNSGNTPPPQIKIYLPIVTK